MDLTLSSSLANSKLHSRTVSHLIIYCGQRKARDIPMEATKERRSEERSRGDDWTDNKISTRCVGFSPFYNLVYSLADGTRLNLERSRNLRTCSFSSGPFPPFSRCRRTRVDYGSGSAWRAPTGAMTAMKRTKKERKREINCPANPLPCKSPASRFSE